MAIAIRSTLDAIRAYRAAKRGGGWHAVDEGLNPETGSVVALLETLAVSERTPSQSAAEREMNAAVRTALDGLPAGDQLAPRGTARGQLSETGRRG